MEEPTSSTAPAMSRDSDLGSLVRAVRRLTFAVWAIVVVLLSFAAMPWLMYLIRSRSDTPSTAAVTTPADSAEERSYDPDFDNDFHARPPEQKIQRATVILLTRIEKRDGDHKHVITEIVKKAPGVRFYYDVGDEYDHLSRLPAMDCEACEGNGQVVFLIGNPATMASSYSYEGERISAIGGLSLAQLRALAQQAPAAAEPD